LSLGTLVVAAVVVVGGTVAFYNDTETSTGNIFTAGSIDLKVDHTRQTYNGVDCKTCDVTLVSGSTTDMVIEKNGAPVTPYLAVEAWVHPAWTAQNDPSLAASNAKWIWESNPTQQADTLVNTSYTFKKEFNWMGPIVSTDLFMAVGSDNGVKVYLNDVEIGSNTGEFGYLQGSMLHIPAVNITSNIVQGNNVLKFVVTNMGLEDGTPQSNPAGLIYKFQIDGNCGDAYFQNHCSLWQEKDLTDGDHFFGFDDIKPADWGTNVISLHVYDNDAYACLITSNKDDQEHDLLETETEDGDAANQGNPSGFGELSSFINVITWNDDGDGNLEAGEGVLGMGPLASLNSIMSMDSLNQSYLVATTTKNIGLAWCAGTISLASTTAGVACDGNGMPNKAQSDSFSADLTAYAEQVRNNGTFKCADVDLESEPEDE